MQTIKYKGYEGSVEVDMERLVCHGKLLFVNDLVTYQGALADIQKEFEVAVDDYIATCKELGRHPQKPVKGAFNVRVTPDLHRAALLRAAREESSLNDMVVQALTAFLECDMKVEHNHNHTHTHQHEVSVAVSQEAGAPPRVIVASTGSAQPRQLGSYVAH